MLHDWKMELYWRMPVCVQELALSLFARRLDKIYYRHEYEECKQWLMGWKNWSRSYVKEYESQRLQYIVETAAKQVPYYRDKWKGIAWSDIRSESDLHLLPTLEKQSIRQNEHSFIANNQDPKSLWVEKTSGTTGTSLKIYYPMSIVPKNWAFLEVMVRNVSGVSIDMPRTMMGGRPIVPGNTNRPPYWRFNRRWRQLYFSSYHVSKKTAPGYIAALRKYGTIWMTGYGSAIAALAEGAMEAGVASYPLRSVIVSGDTLQDSMRLSIEKFFQCKCYNSYGQSEWAGMATECNQGQIHVVPMFGILEILREDGSPCKPGEVGEIVGTSLLNDAMPFIRYRTGDYAAWAEEQNCSCGNANRIITKLVGRTDDYLVTSDGRKIGRLSTAIKRSPTIHSAQVVQDRPGHAYLLVRPGEGYRSSHATSVSDDIQERIGKFEIEIVEVPEIPKTPKGKTVLVIRLSERPAMKDMYKSLLQ